MSSRSRASASQARQRSSSSSELLPARAEAGAIFVTRRQPAIELRGLGLRDGDIVMVGAGLQSVGQGGAVERSFCKSSARGGYAPVRAYSSPTAWRLGLNGAMAMRA